MPEPTDRDREMVSRWRRRWFYAGSIREGTLAELELLLMRAAAREEGRAEERERWLECARYDATMEGPLFKGWNRSALDRLRIKAERIASCCDTAGSGIAEGGEAKEKSDVER